jgi:hypothetical protein
MNRKEILDAAAQCVLRDRNNAYGGPEQSFGIIAELWSINLRPILKDGCSITAAQVALCMIGLKMARLIHNPTHEDSIVDIVGYGACMADVATGGGDRKSGSERDPESNA